MSDANHVSEVRREAARARWGNQVAVRAAETVIARADELEPETAIAVGEAVARQYPDWFPASVRAAWEADDQETARYERHRAEEVASRAERRRGENLQLAARQAAERGEHLSVIDVALGRVPGRDINEILASAAAAADREDAYAEWQARKAAGEKLHMVGELEPSARSLPLSGTGLEMARQRELFADRLAARRKADEADEALRQRMPELGSAFTRPS